MHPFGRHKEGSAITEPQPLDFLPDGLVLLDASGYIQFANRAVLERFGYSLPELQGQSMEVLVPTFRRAFRARSSRGRLGAAKAVTGRTRDGRELPLEVSRGAGLGDEAAGSVVLIRDPSRSTSRVAELEHRRREAEARAQWLEELYRATVHDLRHPLAVAEAHAHLLQESATLDPADQSRAARILGALYRLDGLLTDLVQGVQLESGEIALRREPLDLVDWARAFVAEQAGPTNQHRVRVDGTGPAVVLADPRRLDRVLFNLLNNAFTYSPEGPVTVRIEVRKPEAILSVADQGMGIAPDDLAQIFVRRFRSPSARRRYREGTGLGLFIARNLVESHGGRIWAESVVGLGSTFSFALPVWQADGRGHGARGLKGG